MPSDLDAARERKKKMDSGRWWRADVGENHIRVLPPESDWFGDEAYDWFAIPFNQHLFRLGKNETRVVRCLRDKSEECPACEAAERDWDDPGLAKKTQYKGGGGNISQWHRRAMNILDLDNPDDGVQQYHAPYTVWEAIFKKWVKPKWGPDLISPSEGRNITVDRPQNGPNYDVDADPDTSSIIPVLQKVGMSKEEFVAALDNLEASIPDYISQDEMETLLGRMGFPYGDGGGTATNEPATEGGADNPEDTGPSGWDEDPGSPETGNPVDEDGDDDEEYGWGADDDWDDDWDEGLDGWDSDFEEDEEDVD